MPSYRWEPGTGATGRYRDVATGRFVPPSVVRAELDAYLAASHEPVVALQDALRSGAINIADWQTAMRAEIKSVHLNAIAESVGGYQNMTAADYGRAGQIIREQYGYLRDFADEIISGKQRLDGTLDRRARAYINAGRESYYKSINAKVRDNGITHIASKLNPADHCQECIALDGRWYEIGDPTYNPPGNRICQKNCKCGEVYGVMVDGVIVQIGAA